MGETIGVVFSLGLGVLLSPEIVMVGLWIGASKAQALKKSWLFFIGGIVGLFTGLAIGFFFIPSTSGGPSLVRCIIRAAFGTILILLGLKMLIKGRKERKTSRFITDVSLKWALVAGLLCTGLNLKALSFSLAAGHQLGEASFMAVRVAGLAIFLVLSIIPLILPAALETVRAGFVLTIMEPCNRFLHNYGRWIGMAICFILGAKMLHGAWIMMPF